MYVKLSRSRLDKALARLLPIVPSRPLNPIEGQVRLAVDDGSLILDVTDGQLSVRLWIPDVEGEGVDVFPAHRLSDFVDHLSGDDLMIATDENRTATISTGSSSFTTPLLRDWDFPAFPAPDDDYENLGEYTVDRLEAGLNRVFYAIGGEKAREDFRMVRITEGTARAFSGLRAQVAKVADSNGDHGTLDLVDYVVQPLARFLRTSESEVVQVNATTDEPKRYVFVVKDAIFACLTPAVQFVDMTNVLMYADEQLAGSGELTVEKSSLLDALEGARLQAPPDQMAVALDLTTPVRVHSQMDDLNVFQAELPESRYEGTEEGRTVTVLIDDLMGVVNQFPGTNLRILVAEAKYGKGQRMPMLQLRDDDNAPGIVAQADR